MPVQPAVDCAQCQVDEEKHQEEQNLAPVVVDVGRREVAEPTFLCIVKTEEHHFIVIIL